MAEKSTIEWTESSWNPMTGCSKISEGCAHCYAERMARRLQGMGQRKYRNGFEVTLHQGCLKEPFTWQKPHLVFVCSMGDLFHDNVPVEFIKKVFDTIKTAHWHTFQVLTKRSDRLKMIASELNWPDNLWMGVTVESNKYISRISNLLETPAKVKFLSLEPLLSDIEYLSLKGIDWVIVGGESGAGARPIRISWVRRIKKECQSSGVPFFFKQWGGLNKKTAGRILDGKTWNQMPHVQSNVSIPI